MAYYAVPIVVVVEASTAEEAYEAVNPPTDAARVEDDVYLGAVYSGNACPITREMAADPDYSVEVFYGASESDIASGRALPLMDGDD